MVRNLETAIAGEVHIGSLYFKPEADEELGHGAGRKRFQTRRFLKVLDGIGDAVVKLNVLNFRTP